MCMSVEQLIASFPISAFWNKYNSINLLYEKDDGCVDKKHWYDIQFQVLETLFTTMLISLFSLILQIHWVNVEFNSSSHYIERDAFKKELVDFIMYFTKTKVNIKHPSVPEVSKSNLANRKYMPPLHECQLAQNTSPFKEFCFMGVLIMYSHHNGEPSQFCFTQFRQVSHQNEFGNISRCLQLILFLTPRWQNIQLKGCQRVDARRIPTRCYSKQH